MTEERQQQYRGRGGKRGGRGGKVIHEKHKRNYDDEKKEKTTASSCICRGHSGQGKCSTVMRTRIAVTYKNEGPRKNAINTCIKVESGTTTTNSR